MELFTKDILKYIPSTDPNNQYWLVRAEGGKYYNDFYSNNYIAIGWNVITQEDIANNSYNSDLIRAKLLSILKMANNTKNKRSMGSAAKQMIRFQEEIRPGNVVMVPSENSDSFIVGVVKSEVYTETDEEKLELGHCPYNKRRKVEWFGAFSRSSFDPSLRSIVYAAHTISNITRYKGFINRVVFDTYTEADEMHMTFNTHQSGSVDLDTLTDLLNSYKEIANTLFPDEKIEVKINLQSPGPIEIVGGVMIISSIAGLIWNNSSVASSIVASISHTLKHGGKLSAGAYSLELPNRVETENNQKNKERELSMQEAKNAVEIEGQKIENLERLLSMAEKFGLSLEDLNGEFPETFTNALLLSKQEAEKDEKVLEKKKDAKKTSSKKKKPKD